MTSGEDLVVPIEWLVAAGGIVFGMFAWWVKREFDKNDMEHNRTYRSIIRIHKRLDFLIAEKCYEDDEPEET